MNEIEDRTPAIVAFCNRRYPVLAAAVLALAAFNLTFRLGREVVHEWDESLYAISAWELVTGGHWIGTTFLGTIDYYNTKPPLNVWLIALAFKAFGRSLISLRLVSVLSAWLTVMLLQIWTRRCFGATVALLAGTVLATTFGFLYIHAGRTAETDALFTLLILLTVITLWAEEDRPWRRVWLGPLAAAVFLLRGMAVLMPLCIALAVVVGTGRIEPRRRIPTLVALLLFIAPVGAWVVARWRLDEWRFLERLFNYDFVARTFTTIEGHPGTPLYYLKILSKHHYEWLLAGVASGMLFPLPWPRLRQRLCFWRRDDSLTILLGSWTLVTFFMPTLMVTKVPWYLNPFYPVFALGVAWVLVDGLSHAADARRGRRGTILAVLIVSAVGVAEGKLLWYSFHHRDLERSVQGLLLEEGNRLKGRRVFRREWDRGEIFVLGALVGAEWREATLEGFRRKSRRGDCFVSSHHVADPALVLVRSRGRHSLYCRLE
jgi:4-amino-4-deoxy-L-arabinose transferase-like glycosyltransferase